MKTLKKTSLLLIIITFFAVNGFTQVSVSFYNSSLSKIGVAYNFNDKIWTELRVYSNTFFEDITPELVVCYNVINKEKYNIYAGIGGVVNYFNGIVLPVGVQFSPFEKLANFTLHIECQPTFDTEDEFLLQSSWGLRYMFNK